MGNVLNNSISASRFERQVTENYTFDPQTGLLTNQKATKNGSTTLLDLSYEYNRNNSVGSLNGKTGHLTKITDNLNSNKNREYEFDVLGRLTKAKGGPTGNLWNQVYQYDRYGNRTNVTATGVAADSSPIPIDGIPNLAYDNTTNRIATSGYQYDVNGNMTRSLAEDGVTWVKHEYDAANRLNIIRKDDANQTQLERFQYDSTNARVQSHDPALDRYKSFFNTGGTTLAEFTEFTVGIPTWTKSYTYFGGNQLATITPVSGSENVEFNHPDRLGTKVKTNQSAGTSAEQAHLPFGRPLDAESSLQNNNKRFTSYDRSEKTSLDYAVNRTYDSKLGRFTQVDPIGVSASSLAAPQTLNMYSYCGNDPVNYVDPSGLFIGQFFRWLGRVLLGLSRSRVARRIAIKFVVNYALSGGNFGVAIRSVLPDILQSTGIFPDPRSTVPWMQGTRLPISLGTSSLSKYIILNLMYAARDKAVFALKSCAVRAFLFSIADKETEDAWYDTVVKGRVVSAPDPSLVGKRNVTLPSYPQGHPNIMVQVGGVRSSAAGRYQITKDTWTDFGRGDFTPANQDLAATRILIKQGAIDSSGSLINLQGAVNRANGRWTSLPGGKQQRVNFERFKEIYDRYRKSECAGLVGSGVIAQ